MSSTQAVRPLSLHPAFEQKVVHILVRWLLIILAFHFVSLSVTNLAEFGFATKVSYVFILSNLLLMAVPRRHFLPGGFVNWLMAADFAFISLALYFIREPRTQYHWLYICLLGLLGWRRKAREVLLAMAGGFMVYALATRLLQGCWLPFHDAGDFLRLSSLFAVAFFYFYVLELLGRNAQLFHIVERAKHEWERTADAMSEYILLVDQTGLIQRVNRTLAERLGKKPADLVDKSWQSVLDAGEAPLSDCPLSRMLAAGTPVNGRFAHRAFGQETFVLAIPLFEGDQLAGGIYVLRPPGGLADREPGPAALPKLPTAA